MKFKALLALFLISSYAYAMQPEKTDLSSLSDQELCILANKTFKTQTSEKASCIKELLNRKNDVVNYFLHTSKLLNEDVKKAVIEKQQQEIQSHMQTLQTPIKSRRSITNEDEIAYLDKPINY